MTDSHSYNLGRSMVFSTSLTQGTADSIYTAKNI